MTVARQNAISADILLDNYCLCPEEIERLYPRLAQQYHFTLEEIIALDISARSRVRVLLRNEFFTDAQLIELSCDFAERVLPLFEARLPDNRYPRMCLEFARLYLKGEANTESLIYVEIGAFHAANICMERRQIDAYFAASAVSMVVAVEEINSLATVIASFAQAAVQKNCARSKERVNTRCIESENEAAWQLMQIIKKLL